METPTATPQAPVNPTPAPTAQPGMSNDSIQHLESLFNENPPADKPPEAIAPAPEPKPAAPKAPEKPAEKPADKKPEPPKKENDGELKGAAQLRKAYDDLKVENARLAKLLEEKSKPVDDDEKKTLRQQVEDLNKRFTDTDSELRFVRYEKSHEYREKYEQPMHKALKDAEAEISELLITEQDGSERKATIQDFAKLVDMPPQLAAKQAKEWFGDVAPEVLAHRRKITELSRAAKEAIEDYKKRGADIEKQSTEQKKRQAEELKQRWNNENQAFSTRFKDNFSKMDGDDEGNALLEKGLKMVDLAYNENSGLSPEQMMKVHVVIRNRAAAFGRLEHWLNKTKAERDALNKELQAFKASVPGGGPSPKKQESAGKELSVEDQLMQYATR